MASVRAEAAVADALTAMRHSDSHIARVYSTAGTLGVILLEDLLEQLGGRLSTPWRSATRFSTRGEPPYVR
jgi:CBS domain containing-hemolysin-like protein